MASAKATGSRSRVTSTGMKNFGIIMRVFRNVMITRTVRIEFILDGFLIRPAR